jgi:hypothetical protein
VERSKKQAVRLKYPHMNLDQWVDQLAEIGVRMKLAYNESGDIEMAAQERKEAEFKQTFMDVAILMSA